MKITMGVQSRNSSIELLKIFAIFAIILNHVVCSVCEPNEFMASQAYLLDITSPNSNWQLLLAQFFRYCPGNTIFIICSLWFLVDSGAVKWGKVLGMVLDVWVISIIFLVVFLIIGGTDLLLGGGKKLLLRQLAPTLFGNNWFVTCYIVLYSIHPLLNKVVESLKQKELLFFAVLLSILFIMIQSVRSGAFFCTHLTNWVALFFVIAYFKKYMKDTIDNQRINLIVFCVGLVCLIISYIGFNFLCLKGNLKLSIANAPLSDIFMLVSCFGLFNLVRIHKFHSNVVNYISGCSLFIYVIHENMLVRNFLRPRLWEYIYDNFTYSNLVLWIFLLAIAFFISSLILSTLYKFAIQPFTKKISKTMLRSVYGLYDRFQTAITKLS